MTNAAAATLQDESVPELPPMVAAVIPRHEGPAELERINDLAGDACTLPALRAVQGALAILAEPDTQPDARELIAAACSRLLSTAISNVEELHILAGELGEEVAEACRLAGKPGLGVTLMASLETERNLTSGASYPSGFVEPQQEKLVACSRCREALFTAAEIEAGQDDQGTEIDRTPQQWHCPCCGSWEARP